MHFLFSFIFYIMEIDSFTLTRDRLKKRWINLVQVMWNKLDTTLKGVRKS